MKVFKRDNEDFANLGNQKKRGKKKGGGNTKKDLISHGVDTIDSFALLNLPPPTTQASLESSLEQLRAKKVSFQGLARGEVESISTRLKAEKEQKNSGGKSSKKSVFNLLADFPDLTDIIVAVNDAAEAEPEVAAEEEAEAPKEEVKEAEEDKVEA
jgi:hypothetical protein